MNRSDSTKSQKQAPSIRVWWSLHGPKNFNGTPTTDSTDKWLMKKKLEIKKIIIKSLFFFKRSRFYFREIITFCFKKLIKDIIIVHVNHIEQKIFSHIWNTGED